MPNFYWFLLYSLIFMLGISLVVWNAICLYDSCSKDLAHRDDYEIGLGWIKLISVGFSTILIGICIILKIIKIIKN